MQQEVLSFLIVTHWVQLNVISSSKHQHMVVSALTHSYYMAKTFHCMCRFSFSFIFNLHSPHNFFLFFNLCAHLSHVLLSSVISLPSHLLANPINIPLPFPSSFCFMSEQLPYTLSLYHLSLLYFHLLSYFLQYFIFHTFFFSHIIFPFPSFPPFCYVKYSLGHL